MSNNPLKYRFYAVLFLMAVAAFQAKAEVKFAGIFGDNMVLQQQSQVAVWGWANANTNVKVTVSWNNKSYTAKSDAKGFWKTTVQTPEAGFTPFSLTANDGKPATLKNILIGEVWICSGQSNMEMRMGGSSWSSLVEGGTNDILHSTNTGIRCFTVEKKSSLQLQEDCNGQWRVANPQNVPDFTATGYYFARLVNSVLNVPVGLINTSWGGSAIETWMTPESLTTIPEKKIPTSPDEVIKTTFPTTPTELYNGMIHPIVGFGIRGAIWYQGEANKGEPDLYVRMFDKMVCGWRNIWGVGEFPFYYCQIAPYNYGGWNPQSCYIREAQAKGMQTTPNTGMAVLMDANSPTDIHPTKKRDAGERMALWALAKTYGMDKISYRSPEYKELTVEGRVAIVSFNMFGMGNGLTSYDKDIRNFRIAGENKIFHRATATLSGDKVYIFSPQVPQPVAVRYCWDDVSATEIFSIDGNLPVSSFRSDTW